ncbi:putative 1-acylglycerol-3-phosphate O-acyltransferase [Leptolinea sp. HRD-7]|nr:putative 1-acylglycerol-3-phosphate O-acyltransferase [Leptolinea sp. HRD-7]
MIFSKRFVNGVIRAFVELTIRPHIDELDQVPMTGPYLIAGNHVNTMDGLVMFSYIPPRPLTTLSKEENFSNPINRMVSEAWGAIPIKRGTVDNNAMNLCLEALKEGKMLAILPEGTRSRDGVMAQGKPGILPLAVKSGVPIIPVGFYGHENFWKNVRSFRKTDFFLKVGQPFRIKATMRDLDREHRQIITDELMYRIALLLPEKYRGYYSDLSKATTNYLEFTTFEKESGLQGEMARE